MTLQELLDELAKSKEASAKLQELTAELKKQYPVGDHAFRVGDYNILIQSFSAFSMSRVREVRIDKVQACESTASAFADACLVPGYQNRTRQTLDLLLTAFSWDHTMDGWHYWNDVANKLRCIAGLPLVNPAR